MIITHKITMEMTHKRVIPTVEAVQDDKYSRNLEFTLLADGEAWEVPEGTTAVVRFAKADGTGGNYDTLPDGTAAYAIDGSVVTVALAPQVCTAPGPVRLAVGLINDAQEINTFDVCVHVWPNPGLEVTSEGYYQVIGALAASGWEPNMYLGTDAEGNVSAVGGGNADQSGGGLSTTAVNLLMDVLNAVQYHTNVSGKIEQLREALLSGSSGGGDTGDGEDEPDEPVITDDITVSNGIMTIVTVGSAITVSDGVMAIA